MRAAIIALGVLLLAGALLAALLGARTPGLFMAMVAGALILLGTLAERRRKDLGEAPRGPGWHATDERFVDPETGQLVAVWHNDTTGERCYVRLGVRRE